MEDFPSSMKYHYEFGKQKTTFFSILVLVSQIDCYEDDYSWFDSQIADVSSDVVPAPNLYEDDDNLPEITERETLEELRNNQRHKKISRVLCQEVIIHKHNFKSYEGQQGNAFVHYLPDTFVERRCEPCNLSPSNPKSCIEIQESKCNTRQKEIIYYFRSRHNFHSACWERRNMTKVISVGCRAA